MGKPWRDGTETKNEKMVKMITYAYADVGGKPLHQGVTPGRSLELNFYNEILVGQKFRSSWAEDNTDFDEKKVPNIVKGKTTRAEVGAAEALAQGQADLAATSLEAVLRFATRADTATMCLPDRASGTFSWQ
jgi:hypothetical protein